MKRDYCLNTCTFGEKFDVNVAKLFKKQYIMF